jgi:hypothetical protein
MPFLHKWIHGYVTNNAFKEIRGFISSGKVEFDHQHSPIPGQRFALIQLIEWSGITSEDSIPVGPAIELMLLETTNGGAPSGASLNNSTIYRCIGKLRVQDIRNPWAHACVRDGKIQDAAWDEVVKEEWPVRTVTII